MVAVLLMSIVLGFRLPALPAPNRLAQVPLLVAVAQLLPEITEPATLLISTVPSWKVLLGLTVWALKLASVPLARVPTLARTSTLTISLLKVAWKARGRALAAAAAGVLGVSREAAWAVWMRPSKPAEPYVLSPSISPLSTRTSLLSWLWVLLG